MNNFRERYIARFAYGLWERAGKPDGRDKEFWYAAESWYENCVSFEYKFLGRLFDW